MSSFVEIGQLVPEKEILKDFLNIYWHGGHLGNVTWIIYIYMYIGSPFLHLAKMPTHYF